MLLLQCSPLPIALVAAEQQNVVFIADNTSKTVSKRILPVREKMYEKIDVSVNWVEFPLGRSLVEVNKGNIDGATWLPLLAKGAYPDLLFLNFISSSDDRIFGLRVKIAMRQVGFIFKSQYPNGSVKTAKHSAINHLKVNDRLIN